jgi:hypothetical protein
MARLIGLFGEPIKGLAIVHHLEWSKSRARSIRCLAGLIDQQAPGLIELSDPGQLPQSSRNQTFGCRDFFALT